jgi:hypothetical protein
MANGGFLLVSPSPPTPIGMAFGRLSMIQYKAIEESGEIDRKTGEIYTAQRVATTSLYHSRELGQREKREKKEVHI